MLLRMYAKPPEASQILGLIGVRDSAKLPLLQRKVLHPNIAQALKVMKDHAQQIDTGKLFSISYSNPIIELALFLDEQRTFVCEPIIFVVVALQSGRVYVVNYYIRWWEQVVTLILNFMALLLSCIANIPYLLLVVA